MRRVALSWHELAEAEEEFGDDANHLGNSQLAELIRTDVELWNSLPDYVQQWIDCQLPMNAATAANAKEWFRQYQNTGELPPKVRLRLDGLRRRTASST